MKRRYISYAKNKIGFNLEGISFRNLVVREATPVDDFYFEETISSDNSHKCISYTDPIRMLFNQERLSRVGNTAVESWLNTLAQYKNDPFAELRSKCSDSDLKALIKSRNLQQPSELYAWCEYMQSNMDEFQSEVAKHLAEQQTSVETSSDNSNAEPTN